jgi:hypothetical protein
VWSSPNPQLRIGLRTNPFPVVFIALGVGAMLLICGIVILARLPIRNVT